jgi:hypothetical protein
VEKKNPGIPLKMSLPIFGNHRIENYRDMVAHLLQSYEAMGRNTSLKIQTSSQEISGQ